MTMNRIEKKHDSGKTEQLNGTIFFYNNNGACAQIKINKIE
jgi:hypothetical protein